MREADFPILEEAVKQFTRKSQPFQRLVLSKENILKMFAVELGCPLFGNILHPLCPGQATSICIYMYLSLLSPAVQDNPFKVEMLSAKVPEGSNATVYRCGNLIDPCRVLILALNSPPLPPVHSHSLFVFLSRLLGA